MNVYNETNATCLAILQPDNRAAQSVQRTGNKLQDVSVKIFLPETSRSALGPAQPHFQRVPGFSSGGGEG